MRTINYEIRNPFMCREGQFEEGRTLVVGIRKAFLDDDAILNLKIGKKIYKALTTDLRSRKSTPHVTARGGVALAIMPLYYFELQEEIKPEIKPVEVETPTQQKLL